MAQKNYKNDLRVCVINGVTTYAHVSLKCDSVPAIEIEEVEHRTAFFT